MLNKMAVKITDKLVLKKIVSDDMADIYIYGFELLISFFFSTIGVLIIGIILGRFLQTLMFLATFILLRSFTGGYHASTYAVCSLVTFSLFGVVLLLTEFAFVPLYLYLILGLVGTAIMLLLVPIEHPNKKLSDDQKRKYKVISLVLFLMFTVAGCLFCYFGSPLGAIVFYTLIADIMLLFFKSRKERRKQS